MRVAGGRSLRPRDSKDAYLKEAHLVRDLLAIKSVVFEDHDVMPQLHLIWPHLYLPALHHDAVRMSSIAF